jgi:glycosyltransferase involved in cell wall biosynthesis
MVPFYLRAGVVLNLSHPELWVETFGLTLLEALSFGVPVIAPEVGGPTELVDDGENGYLISVHDVEKIAGKLLDLCENTALCERLSVAARKKAQLFSPQMFDDKMSELIDG